MKELSLSSFCCIWILLLIESVINSVELIPLADTSPFFKESGHEHRLNIKFTLRMPTMLTTLHHIFCISCVEVLSSIPCKLYD